MSNEIEKQKPQAVALTEERARGWTTLLSPASNSVASSSASN